MGSNFKTINEKGQLTQTSANGKLSPRRPENNKEPTEEKTTKDSKELKKKLDKEEKKRLEQEKKEKKEREKKEQEARKKFKVIIAQFIFIFIFVIFVKSSRNTFQKHIWRYISPQNQN